MNYKYLFGRLASGLGNRGFFHNMSDEKYLKIIFPAFVGYDLDLENPHTFNEKLQWLKIHNRKPEYSILVDKYLVREFIRSKFPNQEIKLIPLVGGPWKQSEDIDFEVLPDQFVLKCTHDSQSIIICKDKSQLNKEAVRKKLSHCLKKNLYYAGREWPYKNVEPQIIAEQYMVDESGDELKDYKFFCFNGKPKLVQVNFGRFSDGKKNMYDMNWEYLPIQTSHFATDPETIIKRPACFEKMKEYAGILSAGQTFLRVDFYVINDEIYFGELTFYPGGGIMEFTPKEWDERMGDWMDLSIVEE